MALCRRLVNTLPWRIGNLSASRTRTRCTHGIDGRARLHIRRTFGRNDLAEGQHHTHTNIASTTSPSPVTNDLDPQERFYHHYLTVVVRDANFKPCSGLLELDAHGCRRLLPPDLQRSPLDALDDGNVSLEVATQCLESYITDAYHTGGLATLRESLTKAKAGRRALLWFLKSGQYESAVDPSPEQLRYFRALTFCASAERAEDYVWDWLLSGRMQPGPWGYQQSRYRGDVLRWMVEAQALWSLDNAPLHEALSTFEHANHISRQRRVHIPLQLAGTWLASAFCTEIGRLVRDRDFDRLMESMPFFLARSPSTEFSIAKTNLHRREPNPEPALEWWKSALSRTDQFTRDMLSSTRRSNMFAVFWHILRLAQVLDRAGRHEDARWILDLGRAQYPDWFDMRAPHSVGTPSHALDGSPQFELTPREVRLGMVAVEDRLKAGNMERYVALRKLRGY
ncbi:hypothetical protein LTR56_001485 [Elasticomyces elasticus]|nr:hypothetical protein LTR56_001485 [Elasticomyces elasticus]KAK5768524.1 hypothetical protein LTS12_001312 [Elasticomyces elasticus]